jgi:hypothetical protein
LLPCNTSAFSNVFGASNCATQRKALVSSFGKFDGKPEDVHQHIAQFTQCCVETGVVKDFSYIISENSPPSDVDLTDSIEKAAWILNPCRFTTGNFLLDASQATIEKVQAACDKIC